MDVSKYGLNEVHCSHEEESRDRAKVDMIKQPVNIHGHKNYIEMLVFGGMIYKHDFS